MPPKDEHLKMPTKTLSAKGHCALRGWSLLFFPSPLVHCHLHCPRFSQVTHSPESSRERPYHASADTDLSVETSEFRVLAPRHPFFPRRTFPLPPCPPPVPLAASFAGTRHPLRCAGSSGFPSLSLSPSPNSAPPCRSTFSFSFSPCRSVSCSLRYERAPSRSLPLSLFHFLPRSLERLSPFLSNIPANRSSLRLTFKLSLSLVHALSFPSFSFSLSLAR